MELITRYDFEYNGVSYKEQEDMDPLDLPKDIVELFVLLKEKNIHPLDEQLKIYELTGHIERDFDYVDGEEYSYLSFWEDNSEELTKDKVSFLMFVYKWK